MSRYTLIRRRTAKKRHLYNGAAGGTSRRHDPARQLTLCGQRMPTGMAVLSFTSDEHQIDCADCLVDGIRLAARRDELIAAKGAHR